MPEDIQNQEPTKQLEKPILPVSKEVVDRSLAEISSNPLKAMLEEGSVIAIRNPALFDKLTLLKNKLSENDTSSYFTFQEGASYTYKILRQQAEILGKELPAVSDDVISTFFQDQLRYISETKDEDRKGYFAKQIGQIGIQDPEFDRAIKEFTKYSAVPVNFYFGAVSVYIPIRNALQAEELAKKFQI